jgi:sialate O-acetylesterase
MKSPILICLLGVLGFGFSLAHPSRVGGQSAVASYPTELRLSRIFGDGMVLQRDKPVPVWGIAPPRTRVGVSFRGHTMNATTTARGDWIVKLPAERAGGPFELEIRSDSKTLKVRDIYVGDVWVASGQSNMEFTLAQATNGAAEVAAANDARVRQFKVPTSWSNNPEDDLAGGSWAVADPQHAGEFSAVAYFFAREIRKSVDVPIGIINTTWGGSNIETWMSRRALGLTDSAWSAIVRAEESYAGRVRDSLRAKFGQLPTKDEGLVDGKGVWADPSLDDRAWAEMPVPAYWEANGYTGMDGVAWYRVAFDLDDRDVERGVALDMAAIDDDDITWVNGIEVGRTVGYNVSRSYQIPRNVLRVGKNLLTVRVADGGGGGGINGAVTLSFGGGSPRSLAGRWKFKVGEVSFKPDGQHINKIPTILYNRMLHPLLPFAIKGVIWYQGESNSNTVAQAAAYRDQFSSLITSWRREWGEEDRREKDVILRSEATKDRSPSTAFPFLWVQLPNFGAVDASPPMQAGWATQRESMEAALSLPNTGRAITIDVGGDLHPPNKQDVGARLARVALRTVYGRAIVASGPTYKSHRVLGDTNVVDFANAAGGLLVHSADGRPGAFAIAGADHKFVWANARVVGTKAYVWSESVKSPVAVRYAWANNPQGANLYNRERLPAAPFRTDRW